MPPKTAKKFIHQGTYLMCFGGSVFIMSRVFVMVAPGTFMYCVLTIAVVVSLLFLSLFFRLVISPSFSDKRIERTFPNESQYRLSIIVVVSPGTSTSLSLYSITVTVESFVGQSGQYLSMRLCKRF